MIEEKAFLHDLKTMLSKVIPYVSAIAFGLFAKIGLEMILRKKYTIWQWIGVALFSIFCGYLTAVACDHYDWEFWGKWMPSVATLFGESIAFYIVHNSTRIIDTFVEVLLRIRK